MKEETKNATIRLPQGMADWLTRNGDSINQAIIDSVQSLQSIKAISMNELKGFFTSEEWGFLADSFNGSMITESYRYNSQLLVAHCEDSALYDNLDKKWGIDMEVFKKKLLELRGANVGAVYDRIESFWSNGQLELKEWAKY